MNKTIIIIISLILIKVFTKISYANTYNYDDLQLWQCKYDIKKSPTKHKKFFDLDKINFHQINIKSKDWIWRDSYMNRMYFVAKTKKGQIITMSPKPRDNIDYYYMMDIENKTFSMTAYDHKKKPGQQPAKIAVIFNCISM